METKTAKPGLILKPGNIGNCQTKGDLELINKINSRLFTHWGGREAERKMGFGGKQILTFKLCFGALAIAI